MSISRNVRLSLTLIAAGIALPASAQDMTAQLRPGVQVFDTQNGTVGAITKLADGKVYVQTDRYSVPLEQKSFAVNAGKVYIGLTQAKLDSFYETSILPAEQSLKPGKPVKGLNGATLGTIKEINDSKVVLSLTSGQLVELPRSGIVGNTTGATVGVSASDLAKQLGTSAPAVSAVESK